VLEPQQFTLSAVFVQPWRPVELTGPAGAIAQLSSTGTATGTLAPGQYELNLPYIIPTSSFSEPTTFNSTYSFDLTLTSLPEPAAAALVTALPLAVCAMRLHRCRR
jgi:hypothetical protein